MNLIEIGDEYINAVDQIISLNGILSVGILESVLEPIKAKWEIKAQNLAHYILKLEAEVVEMRRQEKIIKDNMSSKISRIENKADSLRSYLEFNMKKINKKSIKSPIIDITIRKNPTKTIIEDAMKIPPEYIKQKVETVIDKTLIKKDIESGKHVEGAYLEQSETLIINSII